jgi:VanZ family protein
MLASLPIHTTSRHLSAIARWLLVVLILMGSLTWWFAGYGVWAGLASGLLTVLVIQLMSQIAAGDTSLPGSPVHAVLVPAALILIWHLGVSGMGGRGLSAGLEGDVTSSLLLHLALLSLGIMLVQELLSAAASGAVVLMLGGLAMIGSAALGMLLGPPEQPHGALAMLGFAGVGVLLTGFWPPRDEEANYEDGPHWSQHPLVRRGRLAVAAAGAVALAVAAPVQAGAVSVVAGLAMVVGAVAFGSYRRRLLGGGVLLLVCGAAAWLWLGEPLWRVELVLAASPIGRGELADVEPADGGLRFLGGMIGSLGVAATAAVFVLVLAGMLVRSHPDRHYPARAVVWLATATVAGMAMLATGGMFTPSVSLGLILTWGLLSPMLQRQAPRRSGWIMLVVLAMLVVLLGLTRRAGLAIWMPVALRLGDKFVHGLAGFLLALVLAWLLGRRRWYWGLAGAAIAASLALGGEAMQYLLTERNAEWADALAHLAGSGLGAVLYLLAHGARLTESQGAAQRKNSMDAYLR